ncbi:MAG: hypothetical protein ACFCUV_22000, partial [Rivularia sp. (in: cyanobacteria)]
MINIRRLSITVTTSLTICLLWTSLVLAKEKKPKLPKKFPASPLEITVPDPLLPASVKQKPLNDQELRFLSEALDQLDRE